jgi:hydrogenase nickel incorporation protein HypB
VLNKVDLLPYVPFNIVSAEENARRINPGIEIVRVSCTTGDGLAEWMTWLDRKQRALRADSPQMVS